MKYLTFHREDNKFTDILSDKVVKKVARTKLQFTNHLILGIEETSEKSQSLSYIMLKYGDQIIDIESIIPDRAPVMDRDYFPSRRPKKKA
jgi:hypothetical protein